MHYVILRDDDTNALTYPEWLDQLYRPFLDRNLPVNLATIPIVRTDVVGPDGQLEGYLVETDQARHVARPEGIAGFLHLVRRDAAAERRDLGDPGDDRAIQPHPELEGAVRIELGRARRHGRFALSPAAAATSG